MPRSAALGSLSAGHQRSAAGACTRLPPPVVGEEAPRDPRRHAPRLPPRRRARAAQWHPRRCRWVPRGSAAGWAHQHARRSARSSCCYSAQTHHRCARRYQAAAEGEAVVQGTQASMRATEHLAMRAARPPRCESAELARGKTREQPGSSGDQRRPGRKIGTPSCRSLEE